MEATMNGKVMIGTVEKEVDGTKIIGLMIAVTETERIINTTDPEWREGKIITPDKNTLILWIPTLENARVLQDRINLITLELNGYSHT